MVEEEKIIVFLSCLLELFKICPSCGGNRAQGQISFRSGTHIIVDQLCKVCSYFRKWSNQPKVDGSRVAVGNLLLTGAIFACGLSCEKTLRMFNYLNMACFSSSTYYLLLKKWVQPVIYGLWKNEQAEVLRVVKEGGGELVLAGDGRADSPGHCAKYGTYTVMDMIINKIVDLQIVQVIFVSSRTDTVFSILFL